MKQLDKKFKKNYFQIKANPRHTHKKKTLQHITNRNSLPSEEKGRFFASEHALRSNEGISPVQVPSAITSTVQVNPWPYLCLQEIIFQQHTLTQSLKFKFWTDPWHAVYKRDTKGYLTTAKRGLKFCAFNWMLYFKNSFWFSTLWNRISDAVV